MWLLFFADAGRLAQLLFSSSDACVLVEGPVRACGRLLFLEAALFVTGFYGAKHSVLLFQQAAFLSILRNGPGAARQRKR